MSLLHFAGYSPMGEWYFCVSLGIKNLRRREGKVVRYERDFDLGMGVLFVGVREAWEDGRCDMLK